MLVFALVFYCENLSNDFESLYYDIDCKNLGIELT